MLTGDVITAACDLDGRGCCWLVVPNGAEWCRMLSAGWCRIVSNGADWCRMVPHADEWCRMETGADTCRS
eukprot:2663921-Rhodomonas_salina.1